MQFVQDRPVYQFVDRFIVEILIFALQRYRLRLKWHTLFSFVTQPN